MKKIIYFEVFFQISVLICASFAFMYVINEASKPDMVIVEQKLDNSGFLKNILKILLNLVWDDSNFVSAGTGDFVNTCIVSKNNSICQEYVTSICSEKCSTECIPSTKNNVLECKLGTCYESEKGICQISSTKKECEDKGGQWFNDVFGNVKECKKGCCVIKNSAFPATDKECTEEAAASGVDKEFREDITDFLACYDLSGSEEQGACVFNEQPLNSCKFTTKEDCRNLKGNFNSELLCSNPDLKTKCTPQKSVGCAPEIEKDKKDEIYWFDSCGNRENIYDADKVKSFNDGQVLSKEQSCSLSSGSNMFANQQTCGNCNRFLSSICGAKTKTESLADKNLEFVCRSTQCIDENGNKRANGESWCIYQSSIGVDAGISTDRSTDTPGSRHFRKSCIDGEVITEPCYDNRNGICVEAKTDIQLGNTFSTASCRINRAYQCYEYNQEDKKDQCEKNPDCFIKKVDIAKDFKFNFCVPKYKPGFELSEQSDVAEGICKMATQTCKYIKVKGLFKDTEVNKECTTEKFTQQMNDFCMSLGDCGAQVNYLGTIGEGYKISNAPALSKPYLDDITRYEDEKKFLGQVADPGNLADYFGALGIPGTLGAASTPEDKTASITKMGGMVAGAMGALLPIIAHTAIGATALHTVGLGAAAGQTIPGASMSAAFPQLSAFGGALAGAAIGFSLTSLLISFTGIGRGLPPAVVYALMAAGAVAGGIIGLQVVGAIAWNPIGFIIAVVVIIIILIMKLFGIGKVKQVDVTFTCQPWQPPTGGKDCSKCGTDGLPCSKYSCNSLGQSCQIINEDDPATRACVNIAPDDVSSPVIRPMDGVLPENYSYEEFDSGMRIKSSETDGCITSAYTLIPFGITLNEPGQCGISNEPLIAIDKMESFGGSNRFMINHTAPMMIPSLASFGFRNFDPNAKVNTSIYVRCQDKNGNKNERDYMVNFCIKQGPDVTPPIVIAREPAGEEIKFNTQVINATVFLSEPADCRWDTNDKNYSLMANQFECMNELEDMGARFPCKTVFPIIKNESIFYVRCIDQPWLTGANVTKRLQSPVGYQFKLKKVTSPLKIDSITPSDAVLVFGTEPATIEIVATTSGGLDGTAECSFKENERLQPLAETWGTIHKQTYNQMLGGVFSYTIFCRDLIGNTAEKSAKVDIKIDGAVPAVARAYNLDERLFIITNEPAQCVFSSDEKKRCKFEFSNSSEMDGSELVHSTLLDKNIVYYIKCKDSFDNGLLSDSCGIVVHGESV